MKKFYNLWAWLIWIQFDTRVVLLKELFENLKKADDKKTCKIAQHAELFMHARISNEAKGTPNSYPMLV